MSAVDGRHGVPERFTSGGRRPINFVGSFLHVVDAQGRIQLPKGIRKAVPSEAQKTLIVTRGLDGCLNAFPLQEWRKYHEIWKQAMSEIDAREQRNRIRLITSQAAETTIDAQGRISVPGELLKAVSISGEVLIVGALDRIELWDPETFRQAIVEVEESFGADGEGFFVPEDLQSHFDD